MKGLLIITSIGFGMYYYNVGLVEEMREDEVTAIAVQSLSGDLDQLLVDSQESLNKAKSKPNHPDDSDREKLQRLLDESI